MERLAVVPLRPFRRVRSRCRDETRAGVRKKASSRLLRLSRTLGGGPGFCTRVNASAASRPKRVFGHLGRGPGCVRWARRRPARTRLLAGDRSPFSICQGGLPRRDLRTVGRSRCGRRGTSSEQADLLKNRVVGWLPVSRNWRLRFLAVARSTRVRQCPARYLHPRVTNRCRGRAKPEGALLTACGVLLLRSLDLAIQTGLPPKACSAVCEARSPPLRQTRATDRR